MSKEPYIPSKEPYIPSMEPYIASNEPFLNMSKDGVKLALQTFSKVLTRQWNPIFHQ